MKEKGFSLIEVLVSLLLFTGIFMLALTTESKALKLALTNFHTTQLIIERNSQENLKKIKLASTSIKVLKRLS